MADQTIKIEIKSIFGSVLFSYEKENNTMKNTLIEAIRSGADLSDADLSGADLSGANIDFFCLHFSCKSRKPKTTRKQRVQLAHHLLSWIKYADNISDDEKEIFESLKKYANEFHRTDVEKF